MGWSANSICNNCVYCFTLSSKDKKLLETAFFQNSLQDSIIVGFCIRGYKDSGRLIDRVLFDEYPLKHCNFKKTGESRFWTPYKCPICDEYLFVNNSGGEKLFFCISCSRNFRSIEIKINCRFCNTPLTITSDLAYRCECKKCGKGIDIPVLPQVFPSIIPSDELCSHGNRSQDCELCKNFKISRTNILRDEIRAAINRQRESAKRSKENFQKTKKSFSSFGGNYSDGEQAYFEEYDS